MKRKTAYQFIDECDQHSNSPTHVFAPAAVSACEEYMLQEMAAFKQRLKDRIDLSLILTSDQKIHVKYKIDTLK